MGNMVFDYNVAEAAMCLWETYIEAEEGTYPALDALHEDTGTFTWHEPLLAGWLGITRGQQDELCYPARRDNPSPYAATPKQAGKVLRHLARTGEVDWSII